MSYENKILQMKKMLGKKTEQKKEKPKFIKPEKPPYVEQWQQAGLELIENDLILRGILTEQGLEEAKAKKYIL